MESSKDFLSVKNFSLIITRILVYSPNNFCLEELLKLKQLDIYIYNSKTFLHETVLSITDPSIKFLLLLQQFGIIWMSIKRKSIWTVRVITECCVYCFSLR